MIILDEPIPANGTESERLGLVLSALSGLTVGREEQHQASVKKLMAEKQLVLDKINNVAEGVRSALSSHTSATGALHGETKTTIGLPLVDNFRTATLKEHIEGRDDLFCTPEGVKYAISEIVNPDFSSFIPQGVLPIAHFKNPMSELNNDGTTFNPRLVSNRKVNFFFYDGELYGSMLTSSGTAANYLSDLVTVKDKMQFSIAGASASTIDCVGWGTDSGYQKKSNGEVALKFFQYAHGPNSGNYALTFTSGQNKEKYLCPLFDPFIDKTGKIGSVIIDDTGITFTVADMTLTENGLGLTIDDATAKSYQAVAPNGVVYTSNSESVTIPFSSLGSVTDTTSITIDAELDEVDKYHGFGGWVWENKGTSALVYIDAVLNLSHSGINTKTIFRSAYRITFGTNVVINPLVQVGIPIITAGKVVSGNNVLFDYATSDALHPVYGRGPFIESGGHYAGMTSNQSFFLASYTHNFTSLSDLCLNYHNGITLSGQFQKEIPCSFSGEVGINIDRFIPVQVSGDGVKAVVRSMDENGGMSHTLLSWSERDILQTNTTDSHKLRFKPLGSNVTFTRSAALPDQLLTTTGKSGGATVRGLVYSRNSRNPGYDKYVISENDVKTGQTWGIDADSVTFLESSMSVFATRSHTAYTAAGVSYNATNQHYNWIVAVLTTSDDISAASKAIVLMTDACGCVGAQVVSITPNVSTRTFTLSRTEMGTLLNMTYKLADHPNFADATHFSSPSFNDVTVCEGDNNVFEIAFASPHNVKYGMVGCRYKAGVLTVDVVEDQSPDVGIYPFGGLRSVVPINVPYRGVYCKSPDADLLENKESDTFLYHYGVGQSNLTVYNGSSYRQFVIPSGLKLFLDGREFQTTNGLSFFAPVGEVSYVYLKAGETKVSVDVRLIMSEVSVDEIIYGYVDETGNLNVNDRYTVLDGFVLSYTRKGSAIPYTSGFPMDLGETDFFRVGSGNADLDLMMNSTMPEFGGMDMMPDLDEVINGILPKEISDEDLYTDVVINMAMPEVVQTQEENIDIMINQTAPLYSEEYRDSSDRIINQILPEYSGSKWIDLDIFKE